MTFIQSRTRPTISLVTFSITAIVTGLIVFLLPETENRPLPETVQEIEAWSNKLSKQKSKTSNWMFSVYYDVIRKCWWLVGKPD